MNAIAEPNPLLEETPVTLIEQPKPAGALVTIRAASIAQVAQHETALRELAERYRDVVFDVTTSKGLKEAKAALHDLREHGRYAVQRARAKAKTDLNDSKRAVEAEAERLIAFVSSIEISIDTQVSAREQELERIETERVQKHRDNIETIRGYFQTAKTLPVERIAKAVEFVGNLHEAFNPADWEEFQGQALLAIKQTLESLRVLHADTVATAERDAHTAELRRQLAEANEKIAKLQAAEQQKRMDAAPVEEPAGDGSQTPNGGDASAAVPAPPKRAATAPIAQQQTQQLVRDLGVPTPAAPTLETTLDDMVQASKRQYFGRVDFADIEPPPPRFDNRDATMVEGELCITTSVVSARLGVIVTAEFLHDKLAIRHHAITKGRTGFYWRVSDWALICGALSNYFSDLGEG
jgi:hypothetical protein